MVASPIDWTTAQAGIRAWVAAASEIAGSSIRWKMQGQAVQPSSYPFIALMLLGGPREIGQPEDRPESQVMVETVQVVTAAEQIYTINVAFGVADPTPYTYSAGAGETVTQIRDGLLTALGVIAGITIAASGTDSISFTGSAGTPHFHVTASPSPDVVKATPTNAILLTAYEPIEHTLQIEIHSDVVTPSGSAQDYAERIRGSLGLESVASALRTAGVAVHRLISNLDTSYLAGSVWVPRVTMDLAIQLSSQVSEQPDWVRTVDAQLSVT